MVCDPLCSSTKKKREAEWSVKPWLAKVSIRSFYIYGITAKHLEKEFQSVLNIYGKKSTHFENVFESGLIWSQILNLKQKN